MPPRCYPASTYLKTCFNTLLSGFLPETIAISQPPKALQKALHYDVLEYINHLDELPYDGGDNSCPGD
jgi:hypothetical protein